MANRTGTEKMAHKKCNATTQSVKMLQSQTRKIPKGWKLLKKEDTEYEVDNDVKENAGEGEE